MQHLDEGTIHAWLDGALPPEQAADVERHARTCDECAALVADARGVIAGAARIVSALDNVPGGVIPPRQAQTSTRSVWRTLRLTPFRAALAASLMLAVASLLVVRHAAEQARMEVASPAAAAPSPTASTDPADKFLKDAKPTAPAPRRVEAVANAPSPSAAPPAPVVERAKSLAQVAEPKPALVSDSASPRATEAKARAADKVALVPTSTQATGAVAAGAAPTANAAERDAVTRRESASTPAASQPLSLVAMSADDRPIETPGCYQIVRDSLNALPPIPQRFSLELADESGVRRNIVRAVDPAGRRDSVLAGITWRIVPGSTRFVLISNESPLPLMMFRSQATAPAGRGARGVPSGIEKGGSVPRIRPVECR